MAQDYILKMDNITKEFSGVKALDNVDLKVKRGEIHGICGENGAGKSTLMNILSGVYPHGTYSGTITYNGEEMQFDNISDSEEQGIIIIHQELALVRTLSIKENIFLGNEQANRGIINWKKTDTMAENLLKTVGLNLDVNTILSEISVGYQQLVEIAKAFSKQVDLLILDEPTAALNEQESDNLLELLLEFKKQGITSIIISHKLEEVTKVTDNITIIRDGQSIDVLDNQDKQVDESEIVRGMVGRSLSSMFPEQNREIGEKILEVKNWNVNDTYSDTRVISKDNDFHVNRGEVVGIAGLMGAGRTEFVRSIFGKSYGEFVSGELYLSGEKVELNNVREAIDHGLAYVSEDRQELGLNLLMDIKENITLASLDQISNNGQLNLKKEKEIAADYNEQLKVRSTGITQNVKSLSGGNQQKVVLAKWLMTNPDVLILDEPTRGIDVGAKYEIYTIIEEMTRQGKAVIIVSSELPEVIGMSDRIYTMNEGVMTGVVNKEDATQELLMSRMT